MVLVVFDLMVEDQKHLHIYTHPEPHMKVLLRATSPTSWHSTLR